MLKFKLGCYTKEPSGSSRINPQSTHVQKYFQIGPELCTGPPELLGFRTRRPPLAVLRANPCNYGLITRRSLVFAQNP